MKTLQILFLSLVVALLVSTGCSKTVLENQSASDQNTPAAEDTSSSGTMAESDTTSQNTAVQASDAGSDTSGDIQAAVYFDFDSAMLDAEDQSLLQMKAQWLKDNPGVSSVLVEGHCDERGTDAYNMALGARRATAVKDYLVDMGVEMNKLDTQSYGEEKPAIMGHDESAWAKNRRANFVIN